MPTDSYMEDFPYVKNLTPFQREYADYLVECIPLTLAQAAQLAHKDCHPLLEDFRNITYFPTARNPVHFWTWRGKRRPKQLWLF